jgi:hypothetical protein
MPNFGLTLEQRLTPSIARAQELETKIGQSLRVFLPAVVQSFNPGPPATVSVLIATNERVEQNTGGTVYSLKTEAMQLPLLQDVPVMMPSAGGWSLTFPIQPGDECLVVFADTALDVWFQNGGVNNNPISQRRHSLSDAVAIFGLRSRPRGLAGYSTSSAQLRNDDGTVVIDLTDDQVTVTAPAVAVECSGEVSVQARTVSVEAETATVQANAVTLGSATTIDGKAFLTHVHSGVQGGLSTTGPVA